MREFISNTVRLIIFIWFSLLSVKSFAQFPIAHNSMIRMSTDTSKSLIIYQLDGNKLYFNQKTLLKYLRNRQNEMVYKRLFKNGIIDSDYYSLNQKLTRILKTKMFINGGDTKLDHYRLAINKLLPYILINDELAILDEKTNKLIKSAIIIQNQTDDFKGFKQILTLQHLNKVPILELISRRSSDGNDLNEIL